MRAALLLALLCLGAGPALALPAAVTSGIADALSTLLALLGALLSVGVSIFAVRVLVDRIKVMAGLRLSANARYRINDYRKG